MLNHFICHAVGDLSYYWNGAMLHMIVMNDGQPDNDNIF